MKSFVSLFLAAVVAAPAFAADGYSLDTRHTYPSFEISHMGFSLQSGRFNKASGKITLDAAAQQGSVQVSIDTASIDMGLEDWDKHMRGEDFFNVQKFPTMTYVADTFIFEGGKPVAAEGTLTLLGVSQPVKLTIAGFKCGFHFLLGKQVCGANLSTTLKRSDFGMTRLLPMIGDEVRIRIPVEAIKD